jgi:hypothetical protein
LPLHSASNFGRYSPPVSSFWPRFSGCEHRPLSTSGVLIFWPSKTSPFGEKKGKACRLRPAEINTKISRAAAGTGAQSSDARSIAAFSDWGPAAAPRRLPRLSQEKMVSDLPRVTLASRWTHYVDRPSLARGQPGRLRLPVYTRETVPLGRAGDSLPLVRLWWPLVRLSVRCPGSLSLPEFEHGLPAKRYWGV